MIPPLEELVPHARPALLLDRVVESRGDVLVTETRIREDNPYCAGGRVGAWVGIELIAQGIAALAGLDAVASGRPVRLGFLLGTRRYRSSVPWFAVGERLRIEVTREFQSDDGLGVEMVQETGNKVINAVGLEQLMLDEILVTREAADRDGGGKPVVESHQPPCARGAHAHPHNADPLRIDFGAGCQIVERHQIVAQDHTPKSSAQP